MIKASIYSVVRHSPHWELRGAYVNAQTQPQHSFVVLPRVGEYISSTETTIFKVTAIVYASTEGKNIKEGINIYCMEMSQSIDELINELAYEAREELKNK